MAFGRLSESVQTLYAELLDQTIQGEAEAAMTEVPQGTFVSKNIKGGTYWYLQRMEGNRKRQQYLGRESASLLAWIANAREARARNTRLTLGADADRRKSSTVLLIFEPRLIALAFTSHGHARDRPEPSPEALVLLHFPFF